MIISKRRFQSIQDSLRRQCDAARLLAERADKADDDRAKERMDRLLAERKLAAANQRLESIRDAVVTAEKIRDKALQERDAARDESARLQGRVDELNRILDSIAASENAELIAVAFKGVET